MKNGIKRHPFVVCCDILLSFVYLSMEKILVKYPTRSRPELFLKTISEYYSKAFDNSKIEYLISYDEDDDTMTSEVLAEAFRLCPQIKMHPGKSESKIHACNRDVEHADQWDIMLLVSDDMEVQVENWDQIIRSDFKKYFPEGDGVLWYHDGSKQKVITTLSCMDKKYYDTFGYIYYRGYKSFFSDNEFTEVAKAKNKIRFIDHVIIKHQHPQWGEAVKHDSLYEKNNVYWKHDQELYNNRRNTNFPL